MTPRRTRIVATIGPASESPATLRAMVEAGMDVARLGLAHGPVEENIARFRRVRGITAEAGRVIGVLADLPGPKIRSGAFPDGGVFLKEGEPVRLAPSEGGEGRSDWQRIEVDHDDLLSELEPGDGVALGDGGVTLRIDEVDEDRALATVVSGGRLQGRPGVNLPPGRSRLRTPTAEDLRLLEAVMDAGVTMVALSFVQTAADIEAVRKAAGPDGPMVIAKIETRDAVQALDSILEVAEGVMVARGDLGVRLPLEDVPHEQKRIIRRSVAFGRPVITATQMLESMVHAPTPTRAEVSDVANAVIDGTSALMLSGETAIGHDPVTAVATMARIAERAEQDADFAGWGARLGRQQSAAVAGAPPGIRITAAITAAAWRAALDAEAVAIICATRSGATARAMARFRPVVPLLAVTPRAATAEQLSISWGMRAVLTDEHATTDDIVWFGVERAVRLGLAVPGDVVVVLAGSPDDPEPATDVLRLVRVR